MTLDDYDRLTMSEIVSNPKLMADYLLALVEAGQLTPGELRASMIQAQAVDRPAAPVVPDFTQEALSQADAILHEAAQGLDRLYFTSSWDEFQHTHFYRCALRQAGKIIREAARQRG